MDDLLDSTDIAERYGVSAQRGQQLVSKWIEQGTPAVSTKRNRHYVRLADLEAWEATEREAGRPLPGERPRGPAPRRAAE